MAKQVLSQKERIIVSLALVLVFILVVGAIGYVAFQRLAPSPPASVRDFFTDDVVASLSDSSFTVTIPGFGTAVYRMEQAPEKICEEVVAAVPALEEKDVKVIFIVGVVLILALAIFLYTRKKK